MKDELKDTLQKFPSNAFWKNVKITQGCWIWKTKSKSKGRFLKIKVDRPKNLHRNLYACHKCDNPSCVRPSHIFWGTPQQNTMDAVKKGRWPARGWVGKKQWNTKIEKHHIWFIRAFTKSAHSKSMAKILNLKHKSIWSVASGVTWPKEEMDPHKCMKLLLMNHRHWLSTVIPSMYPRNHIMRRKSPQGQPDGEGK